MEREGFYECTDEKYGAAKSIQRVATWASLTWLQAERLMFRQPVKFRELLAWANVEADAEPLRQKTIAEEARRNAGHDEYADPSAA